MERELGRREIKGLGVIRDDGKVQRKNYRTV